MTARSPKAPAHLAPATRAWWAAVCRDFLLEGHHLRLLQAACEAWDRMQEARTIIAAEGMIVRDRFDQPRTHPAVAVERDAKTSFARLIRELDLDTEPTGSSRLPEPPALRSNRRI